MRVGGIKQLLLGKQLQLNALLKEEYPQVHILTLTSKTLYINVKKVFLKVKIVLDQKFYLLRVHKE